MKRVQPLLTLPPSLTLTYSSISHHYISSLPVTALTSVCFIKLWLTAAWYYMRVDLALKLQKELNQIQNISDPDMILTYSSRKALVSSSIKVSQVQINKPNSQIKRRAKKLCLHIIFGPEWACPDSKSCLTYCNYPPTPPPRPHTSLLASLSPSRPPSLAWLFLIMYLFV